MAKQREVTVIQGHGAFTGPHEMVVESEAGGRTVSFARAIIAAGSQPFKLPGLPWDDPRVMDSTGALALSDIGDWRRNHWPGDGQCLPGSG
jgi:dihydrolipoamide dehydrogenase